MRRIKATTGYLICLAFTLCLGTTAGHADAQPAAAGRDRSIVNVRVARPGVLQRVELTDGSVLYGRIVEAGDERVVVEPSAGGRVELRRVAIASVRQVKGRVVNGIFQPAVNGSTRLFFAPTARPIPKNEATFGVYELFLPFLQVGVTDWLSLGGGTPLVFGGDGTRPVWFTPKATLYARGSRYLGAGVIHITGVDQGTGIAYSVGTFGEPEGAVTLGVGYAYSGKSRAAILMVGGEKQLSRSVRLITENWFWKGGYGIVSGGVRFTGEHLAADIGLGVPMGVDDFFAFPLVNFSYRF